MTKIEWTWMPGTKGESWNPIRARNLETGGIGHFCIKKAAGCVNCYAERLQPRFRNQIRYAAQDVNQVEIFLDEDVLAKPLHWTKPRTIFPCSMTDLFGPWVTDEMRDRIFAVEALCPQHTFINLTKRSAGMRQYMTSIDNGDGERLEGFRDALIEGMAQSIYAERTGEDPSMWLAVHLPLPNALLGVSVSEQKDADASRDDLKALADEGWTTFASYEPALDLVDWTGWEFLRWLIFGGESGSDRRDVDLEWGRIALRWCRRQGIAFFGKQNNKVDPLPDDLMIREWPKIATRARNTVVQDTEN